MQSRISPNGRFRLGVCKKTSVFRCLTQKGAGAHRHTSNLYDELLADIYFVLNECEARPHPDSKIRSFDRDIESKLKIMWLLSPKKTNELLSGIIYYWSHLKAAIRRASLDASPNRVSVCTDVQTLRRTAGRYDTSSSLSAERVPTRTPKFEVSIGISSNRDENLSQSRELVRPYPLALSGNAIKCLPRYTSHPFLIQ